MKKTIITLLITISFYATAQIKVGNNPDVIDSSSLVEVESTTKGVLYPRMTNLQAYAITTPAIGLIVFNTSLNCLSYYDGTTWNCTYVAPQPTPATAPLGSTYTNHRNGVVSNVYTGTSTTVTHTTGETFNNLAGCSTKMISAGNTSCPASVTGVSGTVYPLVLINGQCWFNRNLNEIPTNFALNTPTSWLTNTPGDQGYSGYVNNIVTNGSAGWGLTETSDLGFLYQWSAAMNNSRAERARGNCPIGYHVPSDCEWSYLEHGLGMSLADNGSIDLSIERGIPAEVSTKLKVDGLFANNASGFRSRLTNRRNGDGQFVLSNVAFYFSSTLVDPTVFGSTYNRSFYTNMKGLYRQSANTGSGQAIRCLKD